MEEDQVMGPLLVRQSMHELEQEGEDRFDFLTWRAIGDGGGYVPVAGFNSAV